MKDNREELIKVTNMLVEMYMYFSSFSLLQKSSLCKKFNLLFTVADRSSIGE